MFHSEISDLFYICVSIKLKTLTHIICVCNTHSPTVHIIDIDQMLRRIMQDFMRFL